MSNPFQLTFTLKQHTPIIHFQHDQAGATLRATEVKPKLDLFIMKKCLTSKNITWEHDQDARNKFKQAALHPGDDEDKKYWKNWLVGKGKSEHVALDYKIAILDTDTRPINQRRITGISLINEEAGQLKTAVYSNLISVKIISGQQLLRTEIANLIELFFVIENFGNRQNKGWGCFFHERTDSIAKVKYLIKEHGYIGYILNISNLDAFANNYNFYKKRISLIWRQLKSGINFPANPQYQTPARYNKSSLFKYMASNNLRWDKRWIKRELNRMITSAPAILPQNLRGSGDPNDVCSPIVSCNDNSCTNRSWNDNPANIEYRFGRAMLGLAEHFEFRALNGYTYQVIVGSLDGIERSKASITFKVFNGQLLAIVNEIPNYLFDKRFTFQVKQKQNNIQVNGLIDITDPSGLPKVLQTPSLVEFSVVTFLDNYLPCLGFSKI